MRGHTLDEQATLLARRYAEGAASERLAADILALVRGASGALVHGVLEIDERRRSVALAGRPIPVAAREFALLVELARSGDVVDRQTLRRRVLGLAIDPGTNALDVHVHRLRMKLGAGSIETVRHVGYRLAIPR